MISSRLEPMIEEAAGKADGSVTKNMAHKFVGNLSILVHNQRTPTDEESRAILKEFLSHDLTQMRTLIWTDGGGPNAAQRKALTDALGGRTFPTAVVATTTVVRGIVTALSWFNDKMKAFRPDELDKALVYLGIPAHEHAKVREELEKLRLLLKLPNPRLWAR